MEVQQAPAGPTPAGGGSEAAGFPLSHGQRALWFLDRLAPGDPAYVIAGAARVPSGLDGAALRRAALALAARHPGLRTTFHATPDGPVQRVAAAARVDFREERATPDGNGGGNVHAVPAGRIAELAYLPFSLAEGPLWRVALLHLAGGDDVLVLAVHHVVADFWSLAVMVGELGALYTAEAAGAPARLAPPAADPAEAAEREARRLAGPEGERLWQFWRGTLAGMPAVLELPADRPRPAVPSHRGGVRRLALPAGEAAALRRAARSQGATLYMALLAAFDVLLQRISGQDRLVVGCPTTGRKTAELQGVVGYLVNPVAIAVDLGGDPHFSELLGRVREAALAAFAHQDLPLPLLAERLQPGRDTGASPLFQTMCVLQKGRRESEAGLAALSVGVAGVELAFGDRTLVSLTVDNPGAQFDLSLALADTPAGLTGRLIYSRDLFDPPTAARLARQLETLLAAWAAEPAGWLGRRLAELPLLGAAERHQLLVEWNDQPLSYPPPAPAPGDRLVPARIAALAAGAPDAICLSADHEAAGEWLSYGELAARAAQMGGRLAAAGVGPESVVAVLAGRSFATVGALLAVWWAGGAFLPLDASLPDERLALILADAGVAAVVVGRALFGRALAGRLANRLPAGAEDETAGAPRLVLEELWAAAAGPGAAGDPVPGPIAAAAAAVLHPALPAYVIYTSGSSGRPKGVVVPHSAVANRLEFGTVADYPAGETYLHKTTLSFDAAIGELFGPLLVGGRLAVARPGGSAIPATWSS